MRQPGVARRKGRAYGVLLDGERLREFREQAGLTREALEEVSGLTGRTILSAEKGGPVSIATLRTLADALGVPYIDLWRPTPEQTAQRLIERGLAAPPPPRRWSAREAETAWVREHLAESRGASGLVCVTGPTGIGKTALARYVTSLVAPSFPDGVVWLRDGDGLVGSHPQSQQGAIAEAFGFEGRLPDVNHVGQEAFDRAFQSKLWRHRCLLVLDDVVSQRYVRHFVAADGGVACLVTTLFGHIAETADELLVLEGLPDEAAWALVAELIGEERLHGDPAGAERLLHLLAGFPRALQLAGAVLRREKRTTPGDYADRIAEEPADLIDRVEARATRDPRERRNANQLLSYAQLQRHVSSEAWSLLLSLGVFGERRVPIEWVAATAGMDTTEARRFVSELANLFLVHWEGSDTLFVDAHASAFSRSASGELDAWLDRMAEFATNRARALFSEGLAAFRRSFEREREVWSLCLDALVAAATAGAQVSDWGLPADIPDIEIEPRYAGRLVALAEAMAPVFSVSAVPQARPWLVAAFACGAKVDASAATRLACVLGFFDLRLYGSLAHVRAWCEAGVDAGSSAPELAGMACSIVAQASCTFGDHREAPEWFDRAIELSRRAERPLFLATNLMSRACAGTRWQTSPERCEQALALLSEAKALCSSGAPPAAAIRAACEYNQAVIRADRGFPTAKADLVLSILGLEAHHRGNVPVRARLLATAVHYGVAARVVDTLAPGQTDPDPLRRLAGLWSELGDVESGPAFDRIQHLLGEFALFAALTKSAQHPDPPPFVTHGVWPTDLLGYTGHPELLLQPVTALFALQPLVEVTDDALVETICERIAGDFGRQHHIYQDLMRLHSSALS